MLSIQSDHQQNKLTKYIPNTTERPLCHIRGWSGCKQSEQDELHDYSGVLQTPVVPIPATLRFPMETIMTAQVISLHVLGREKLSRDRGNLCQSKMASNASNRR